MWRHPHITSGDWRQAQNPSRFVRINPKDSVDVKNADLLFGNPLTWSDKRAEAYGKNRYSQGEGLQGTSTTRWGLFKDRSYYVRTDQVRLDVLLTYCLMHGLGMKARELGAGIGAGVTPSRPGDGTQAPGAPPGDAIAA